MKIGVIVAMEEELLILKECMNECKEVEIKPFTFYTGKIGKYDVVLLECGVGKVNAAIGATLLLNSFSPALVINTGVAGGLASGMKIGDIAVSTRLYQHDVDVTVLNYELGQIPGMSTYFEADERLGSILLGIVKDMGIGAFKGYIASGDIFIHDRGHVSRIVESWGETVAVEMEAGALAQVCHRFSTPFCAIRAVSDLPLEDSSSVDYRVFMPKVAKLSAGIVKRALETDY